MEGLVNYSSEDEQEEFMDQITAERGEGGRSPAKARLSLGIESTVMSDCGEGVIRRGTPTSRNNNNNYRDEESQRHKGSTYVSANRASSSAYYSRDNSRDNRDKSRDNRDNARDSRDERDSRDARYSKDQGRYDYKNDRARSKDYKSEHRRERDSYDNRRPPREDDRNRSSSASYKNSRYSGNTTRDERPRYESCASTTTSSSLRQQQHHSRPYEHRNLEHYDRASDRSNVRHRRRSTSHSPSPSATQRHYHSKRTSYDDKPHSRHRTRSRSVTPSRSDSREHDRDGIALEQARLSALEMERKMPVDTPAAVDEDAKTSSSYARGTEALLALPLNETAPKQPNVIAVAPPSMSSNTGEPAVIQLPSYYNPNVINPNKYAEQVQKRKLLWGAKKSEDTAAKWGNAQFSQDTDGKVASKFMRLMGIKGNAPAKGEIVEVEQKTVPSAAPDVKSREVMFSNMEQQYEVARQATHTMRGVGLGFSSQSRPF